jgi:microcystin-dependent protein
MDRTVGNYTNQTERDFPFDCETLEYMAANTQMCAMLGNIAGDKTILYGCTLSGTTRSEGYVFLRTEDNPTGEILRWIGGSIASGMHIVNTDVAVGEDYPKAYTIRTLAPGQGSEGDEAYAWTDFTVLATTKDIAAALNTLRGEVEAITLEPFGVIKMWAGSNIPEGYHLCDGSSFKRLDYPNLFSAIGTTFNSARDAGGYAQSTPSDEFRIPDLRGRFVVGQYGGGDGFHNLGDTGGSSKVQLSINEMPSHSHTASFTNSASDDGNSDGTCIAGARPENPQTVTGIITIGNTGGSAAHENRPPFYVLAYIIKMG